MQTEEKDYRCCQFDSTVDDIEECHKHSECEDCPYYYEDEYVGQFTFVDNEHCSKIAIMFQDKNYLLEPIYADQIICGYKVYEQVAND